MCIKWYVHIGAYALSVKTTLPYAFGVLILEVVIGKKNGDAPSDDDHNID